jgi:hypothetical protein
MLDESCLPLKTHISNGVININMTIQLDFYYIYQDFIRCLRNIKKGEKKSMLSLSHLQYGCTNEN